MTPVTVTNNTAHIDPRCPALVADAGPSVKQYAYDLRAALILMHNHDARPCPYCVTRMRPYTPVPAAPRARKWQPIR